MRRVFTLGERVWYEDDYTKGWGTIALINGSLSIAQDVCSDYDGDILTIAKDSGGEIETTPSHVYQLASGRTFRNKPVCWEHIEAIDYPFYCPDEGENCYHVELD